MSKKQKKEGQGAQKKLSKKEVEAEVARQQAIAKDVLYPILLAHSKNIKNAQNVCKTVVVGMDAIFMRDIKAYQEKRSKDTLESLNLSEELVEGVEFNGEREIIEALKGESISTARGLVEGMQKLLEWSVDKEIVKRPLSSLTVDLV